MMGIKKSATFSEQEYADAALVAEYKGHTFARYIAFCVNKETIRRMKDALEEKRKKGQIDTARGVATPSDVGHGVLEQYPRKPLT